MILQLDAYKGLGKLVARHIPNRAVVNSDFIFMKNVADVVECYVRVLISLNNSLVDTLRY